MGTPLRGIKHLFLAASLAALTGCGATLTGSIKAPPEPAPTGVFSAGAQKTDITPPPGYPMGGHSIAGRIGRGFWLRLNARAIFLEDPSGRRVALVSADLWSIPAGLADRVAELNSQGPEGCRIGRQGLVLAATHTHQSPGNYSSSALYNAFASPLHGFDSDIFEFLARRIASSIEQACGNKRAARLFYNETRMNRIPFARNRSFEAFLLNPEAEEFIGRNGDLPEGVISPEYPFPQSYRAIDPSLKVLRIRTDGADPRDIAIAAFVSVHATSMTHDAELYNSDLFGYASISAENSLSRGQKEAVVAVFNGAEGDVSPAWEAQDRRDTQRLGRELADSILGLEKGREISGDIQYRFAHRTLAGACLPKELGEGLRADKRALQGAPMMGGAEDGRTLFYDLGWREGVTALYRTPEQGNKQPALDLKTPFPLPLSLTRLVAELFPAPTVIPIGVYTMGDLAIATLPGEFTTVMGQRISAEVKSELGGRAWEVLLIGPANEYISYFTTPEEYEAQSYEAASTLYGRLSSEVVRHEVGLLARSLREGPAEPLTDIVYSYDPGLLTGHFGAGNVKTEDSSPERGLTPVLLDRETGLSALRELPAFCWADTRKDLGPDAGLSFRATPGVSVMTRDEGTGEWLPLKIDGIEESDRGLNFVSVAFEPSGECVPWCVFWMPPDEIRDRELRFRFAVEPLSGGLISSEDCLFDKGRVTGRCRFNPDALSLCRDRGGSSDESGHRPE